MHNHLCWKPSSVAQGRFPTKMVVHCPGFSGIDDFSAFFENSFQLFFISRPRKVSNKDGCALSWFLGELRAALLAPSATIIGALCTLSSTLIFADAQSTSIKLFAILRQSLVT